MTGTRQKSNNNKKNSYKSKKWRQDLGKKTIHLTNKDRTLTKKTIHLRNEDRTLTKKTINLTNKDRTLIKKYYKSKK